MSNVYRFSLPPFGRILEDLREVLDGKAAVDHSDPRAFPELISSALPALSRRLCELGASLSPAGQVTSADVMVCHNNDPELGVLTLRVYESFPNYNLDRVVSRRRGAWAIHVRRVHYLEPDRDHPDNNNSVIAQAVLDRAGIRSERGQSGAMDASETGFHPIKVAEESNTGSESAAGIESMVSVVPRGASDLALIKRGEIVGANIIWYAKKVHAHGNPSGYQDVAHVVQRMSDFRGVLTELAELSKFNALDERQRVSTVSTWLDKMSGSAVVQSTLSEIAKVLVSTAVGTLSNK